MTIKTDIIDTTLASTLLIKKNIKVGSSAGSSADLDLEVDNLTVQGTLNASAGGLQGDNLDGDVYASDQSTIVMQNGTDGTDAWFRGDVRNSSGTTVVDVGSDLVEAEIKGNIQTDSISEKTSAAGVTINNNVSITGNLEVSGSYTTTLSETVQIEDNTIVLNSNATGTPTSDQDAGIEVERGDSTNVTFIWDESESSWSASDKKIISTSGFAGNVLSSDYTSVLNSGTNGTDATFTGNLIGDVLASNGSSVVLDSGTDGTDATFTGDVTGDVTGNLVGDVLASNGSSTVLDSGTDGTDATFTGDVTGNLTGDVLSSNSSLVLDSGTDGTDATFTGDVTGDVTGTVSDISNHTTTITDIAVGEALALSIALG